MALNLGSLYVSVTAETSGLSKGIEESLKQVERFSKELKRAANDIRDISAVITGMGVAAFAKSAEVSRQSARALDELALAGTQVAVPLANALLPVIQEVTRALNEFARYISGLTPEMRSMIVTIAEWAIGLTVGATIVAKIAGVVAGLAGMAAMLIPLTIPLLEILAVVAAVAVAAVFLHKVWRENWGGVQQFVSAAVKDMGEAFSWLIGAVTRPIQIVMAVLAEFIDKILAAMIAVGQLTGSKKAEQFAEGFRGAFKGLFDDLKSGEFIKQGVNFGKQIADGVGTGVASGAAALKEEFDLILDPVIKAAREKFKSMFPKGGLKVDDGAFLQLEALEAQIKIEQKRTFKVPTAFERSSTYGNDEYGPIEQMTSAQNAAQRARGSVFLGDLGGKGVNTSAHISQVTSANSGGPPLSNTLTDIEKSLASLGIKIPEFVAPFVARLQAYLPIIAGSVGEFAKGLGNTLLSKLGQVGTIVQGIINGIKSGNPMEAIGSAFGEILSSSKGFGKLVNQCLGVIDQLAQAVEPLIDGLMTGLGPFIAAVSMVIGTVMGALKPVFETLGKVLQAITPFIVLVSMIFKILAPIIQALCTILMLVFKILEPILRPLFEVARVVLMFIVGIIKAIADIWNAIVDALAAVINGIVAVLSFGGEQHAGDKLLGGLRLNTEGLSQAQSDLANMTYDSASATADKTAADQAAAGAAKNAASGMNALAAALTNAPDMFKIGFARMQADTGQTGYDPRAGNTASSGNPAGTIDTSDGTGSTGSTSSGGGHQGNNPVVHRAQ